MDYGKQIPIRLKCKEEMRSMWEPWQRYILANPDEFPVPSNKKTTGDNDIDFMSHSMDAIKELYQIPGMLQSSVEQGVKNAPLLASSITSSVGKIRYRPGVLKPA